MIKRIAVNYKNKAVRLYQRVKGMFLWYLLAKKLKFKINYKYGEQLKHFKNMHKNERCFIIGNGPSLLMKDLNKLQEEYTFATNKIFLAFDDTKWRPTYYCISDHNVINAHLGAIKEKVVAKNKFIGAWRLEEANLFFDLPDWICFFLDSKPVSNIMKPRFSGDISKQVYEGNTVACCCIQIAVYMGFSEIYLLGCDNNYTGEKAYFKGDSHSWVTTQQLIASSEGAILGYNAAKRYADKHGVKIYNATRGGALEVFERVNFDSIQFNSLGNKQIYG